MKRLCVGVLIVGVSVAADVAAQRGTPSTLDVRAVLKTVAPDLSQRLARFKAVRMPFDGGGTTSASARWSTSWSSPAAISKAWYWRQSRSRQGLALFKALEKVETPLARNLRHYLLINGSRWRPVDRTGRLSARRPMPPGRGFYPATSPAPQVEAYVAAHPDKKAEIYDPYTLVRAGPGDRLDGRLYHDGSSPFVDGAAAALRQAAVSARRSGVCHVPAAAGRRPADRRLLRERHRLARSQYPKFDVIFAPSETISTACWREDAPTAPWSWSAMRPKASNLAMYQQWVPDIQDALPLAADDRPSVRGHVDADGGDGRALSRRRPAHGYQAVADNLPNDPRIHETEGHEEDLLQELHGRARERSHPAAGGQHDGSGTGEAGVG